MHRFIDDLLQLLRVDIDVDVDDDNKERFVLVSDTALVFNKYRPEQYRRSSSSSSLSSTSVKNTSSNDKEYDRWNAKNSQKRRNINVQKEMSDSCLTIPKRSWSSSPTMTTDSCLIIPKRTSRSKDNRNNNSKQLMAEMKYSNVSIPQLNNGDKIQQTNNTDETVSTTTTIERITSASDDAASSLSAAAEPTEPLVGRRRKRDSIYLHKQRYQHDIKE